MRRAAIIHRKHHEHGFAFGDAFVRVTVTEPALRRDSAPTLYFLHGRYGDSSTWEPLLPKLTQFRCVCVDFPGFGSSFSTHERGFSLSEHVRLMNEVLARLPAPESSVPGVVLVGHDFGGAVASMIAAHDPRRIAGLILLNSASPCEPLPGFAGCFGWKARWELFRELRDLSAYSAESEMLLTEPWNTRRTRKSLVRALHALERTWPGPQERQFWRQSLHESVRAALILWGGRDSIQALDRGIALARLLPNSDFYVDPGSGHWPCLDNTPWVGARIREFVFRLGTETAISAQRSLSR